MKSPMHFSPVTSRAPSLRPKTFQHHQKDTVLRDTSCITLQRLEFNIIIGARFQIYAAAAVRYYAVQIGI